MLDTKSRQGRKDGNMIMVSQTMTTWLEEGVPQLLEAASDMSVEEHDCLCLDRGVVPENIM